MTQRHPYADFVHLVRKPARYLGGEYLSVVKPWDTVDLRICLTFPDLYDIGMSHLGTKILYSLLNDDPTIACERSFAPWVDMEAELRARDLPLVSLESARPLADFDVLGFSLQYEMTYTNVLNMLDLAGIPVRSSDRTEDHPLVIAGGPTVTHPEPMAPFVDAFLVGDGEERLPKSLRAIAKWNAEGRSRREILEGLAAMGGWYCPTLYETRIEPRNGLEVVDPARSVGPYPVVRAFVEDLTPYPFPTRPPVAAAEAIFDRVSIEIARGCTEGCRFCQAGMIYRPVRERDPEQIVDAVMGAIEAGGFDKVSLTSLSTADYSCVSPLIKKVMKRLREKRASLSVSSLRAYGLDEDLLDEISSVKATGLTFAPEAGTQRMRDVVNKNVTEEQLMTTADRVFSRGWSRMKLYFMIGLPTETDEDVIGIIETAARARDICRKYHQKRQLNVVASASSHVPKPHTPFQWAAMDSMEDIHRKQRILRDRARELGITVRTHNQKTSFLEGIVARGDRAVANLIEAAWKKGCRFDSWDEHLKFEAWTDSIQELGLDPAIYLNTLPVDGALPWDHIDVGLEPGFLHKEWKRAVKNRLSPPCGRPKGLPTHHTNLHDAEADERKLVCYHCGVACDLGQMRQERLGFLTKMGAKTPPVREEGDMPAYKLVRKDKRGANMPPRRAEQGAGFHYRIAFTKLGTVALSSQLDLTRSLPRVLRRAGLSLKYSEGFSPKPVLTYGPALPVGVKSLAEVLDITTLEPVDTDALITLLDAVSDPGMVFLRAAVLPEKPLSCARVAKLAEYIVAAPGQWNDATLEAAVASLLGDDVLETVVLRKKGPRTIDIRDGILTASVGRPTPLEIDALGLTEETSVLRYRVNLDEGAHVRADELADRLLGPFGARPVFARTGLWGLRKGRVFDLFAPEDPIELARHGELLGFKGAMPTFEAVQPAG